MYKIPVIDFWCETNLSVAFNDAVGGCANLEIDGGFNNIKGIAAQIFGIVIKRLRF